MHERDAQTEDTNVEPKRNCWEYKGCGREPGGNAVDSSGPCPAAIEAALNGENSGRNAGRACWVVPGTRCGGAICGTFDEKYVTCRKCDFFEIVQEEEGDGYSSYMALLLKLAQGRGEE